MHLGRVLVSTVLFLLPLVHAGTIGQVNAANQALAAEAAKYDGNVNNLNNVNSLTNGPVRLTSFDTSVPSRSCIQGIANDLASLNAAVVSSTQNGKGTPATGDRPTQQTVVNSFTAVRHLSHFHHSCIAISTTVHLTGHRIYLVLQRSRYLHAGSRREGRTFVFRKPENH